MLCPRRRPFVAPSYPRVLPRSLLPSPSRLRPFLPRLSSFKTAGLPPPLFLLLLHVRLQDVAGDGTRVVRGEDLDGRHPGLGPALVELVQGELVVPVAFQRRERNALRGRRRNDDVGALGGEVAVLGAVQGLPDEVPHQDLSSPCFRRGPG